jgi:threonine aldolase
MTIRRGFASDNNSGIHPDILEAIHQVNHGHTIAYGDDPYTKAATEKIVDLFGGDVAVFFVFTGTAANVLGLEASLRSYHSVICAETSHIQQDECGAPEKFTGAKLLPVETPDGKLTPELVAKHLYGFGFEHHSQPRVISITQASEMGTIYTPSEIRNLAELAHSKEMILHMDGARIFNAVASLGVSFREITKDSGVDVLSFGGTKNGMMYGEAVVFFRKKLAENFLYIRKQGMQLASKMRFIAAQYEAMLSNELWLKNASHANQMAKILAEEVSRIPKIRITQKAEINGVFAIIPPEIIPELQKEYFFYEWDEQTSEVRWMTSWDTTEEDVMNFVTLLKEKLG